MSPKHPLKLYHYALSGHAHRVQLALSLMGLAHELLEVDLKKAAHKAPEFLKLNPFGQVPVLDDNGTVLCDSNAILVYLAAKYDTADDTTDNTTGRWMPSDPVGQAEVQKWFSVAAGQIAFGAAAARRATVFGAKVNVEEAIERAHALLKVMEAQLATRNFLVGGNATLADIAGYSYISAAPEGNVDLGTYPHVRAWLARIEALPGFVAFQKTPVGLAA